MMMFMIMILFILVIKALMINMMVIDYYCYDYLQALTLFDIAGISDIHNQLEQYLKESFGLNNIESSSKCFHTP